MEDILRSTNISEDERKVYDAVLEKLDQFFKVQIMSSSKEPNSTDDIKETPNQQRNSSRAYAVWLSIACMVILKIRCYGTES